MDSAIKQLAHNKRRGGELRFFVMEMLRAHIKREFLDQDAEVPWNHMVALIACDPPRGNAAPEVYLHSIQWGDESASFAEGGQLRELYNSLDDRMVDGVFPSPDKEGDLHVGLVMVSGLKHHDSGIITDKDQDPSSAAGIMVNIEFIDGSYVMFSMNDEGYADIAASTEHVEGISCVRIKRTPLTGKDVTRKLKLQEGQTLENINQNMEDSNFAVALINGRVIASAQENELYPHQI